MTVYQDFHPNTSDNILHKKAYKHKFSLGKIAFTRKVFFKNVFMSLIIVKQ